VVLVVSKRRIRLILLIGLFLVTAMLSPVLAGPHFFKPETSLSQNNLSSENFLQESQSLYEAGKFADAIKILEKGINSTNQGLERAVIFSNLSLAYQQLGLWQNAENAIAHSLDLLKNIANSPEKSAFFAQTLDIQARLQLAQGQEKTALSTWKQAANIYQQLGDSFSLIRNQINQASVWQSLGHYLQAEKTLTEVKNTLATEPDSLLKATALRSLGNVLRIVGNFEKSRQVLEFNHGKSFII
jgi:tetratricopeptide (TPR) repeat protein